jgi:predicted nucleic acid-binding Zn ribbon protein
MPTGFNCPPGYSGHDWTRYYTYTCPECGAHTDAEVTSEFGCVEFPFSECPACHAEVPEDWESHCIEADEGE